METFGEWLRGQRNARKLTREEFASRVGCSVAMLRKIEDGERRPSAQIAGLIAACLDVPLEERGTFIKVARGIFSTNRLKPTPELRHKRDISAAPADPVHLPVLPTPLIGRQREIDELTRLLDDPGCSLLTIVGPGGIGKTRLAIETASGCRSGFVDGIYFVPLASIQDFDFMIPALADAIGFNFQGERGLDHRSQLFNYLSEKRQLLLIDNLEQLLVDPATAEFFIELLERAKKIKLLVTSRESLGLQSEWVFEVRGLPIPENSDIEDTSVELFLQRARRAHVGFDPTTEDTPAIVRICKLVDGMPLGIELAAAWVRTLSCDEIANEIERELDFLSVSAKDLPVRHRSMRAVFDHSWELLPEEEQKILLRLSVFQGGFSREAAQIVSGATLPLLSTLVTKSLVRRRASGRYEQHELLRQLARARLQEDAREERAAREQHCAFFMALLQESEPRLKSADQNNALTLLGTEVDNLRLAWSWAIQQKKLSDIRKSAPCLQWFHDLHGWLYEGAAMLRQAAEALEKQSGDIAPSSEYFETLNVLGIYEGLANVRSGKVAQGRTRLQQILERTRLHSDAKTLSDNLAFLGLADYLTGNYEEADIHLTEAIALSRSISYEWITSFSMMIRGMLAQMKGEFANAEADFREGLALGRSIGSPRNVGSFLIMYSGLLRAWHREQEANEMLLESLAIGRAERDQWLIAISLQHLSAMAKSQDRAGYPEAQEMMEESVALFRDLGDRWGLAMSLTHLGEILTEHGQFDEARQHFLEAVEKSVEAHVVPVTLDALVGLAALFKLEKKYKAAAELLETVLQQRELSQESRERAENLKVALQKKVSLNGSASAKPFLEGKTVESVIEELTRGAKILPGKERQT